MGERSAGNLHAAFDEEGAGNVARSKRFGLNRCASPRPYLREAGGATPSAYSPLHLRKTRAGKFQLQRKTRRDRMQAKLREIKEALRGCMHQPLPEQGKWLRRVVRGYFNYHAVPTNARALDVFRHHVTDLWRRTLRRRSHKDRSPGHG